jgi:hypothetical protein
MAKRRTCGDCKHWDTKHYKPAENKGYCESPNLYDYESGPKVWERDSFQGGGFEGYGDYFMTGPDFSCIHWEGK